MTRLLLIAGGFAVFVANASNPLFAESSPADWSSAKFYGLLNPVNPTPPLFWSDRTLTARYWNAPELTYGKAVSFAGKDPGIPSSGLYLSSDRPSAPAALAALTAQSLRQSFSRPDFTHDLPRYTLAAADSDLPTALALSAMGMRLDTDAAFPTSVHHFLSIRSRNGLPADALPSVADLSLPPPDGFQIEEKPENTLAALWWNHQRAVALGDFAKARTTLVQMKAAVPSSKEGAYAALIPAAEARLRRWQTGRVGGDTRRLQAVLDFSRTNPLAPGGTFVTALAELPTKVAIDRANLAAEIEGPSSALYRDIVLYLIQVRGSDGHGLRIQDLDHAWRGFPAAYGPWRDTLIQLACSGAANWRDEKQAAQALGALSTAASGTTRSDFVREAGPFFRSALRTALRLTGPAKAASTPLTDCQPELLRALLDLDAAGFDRPTFEADAAEYLKATTHPVWRSTIYDIQMEAYLSPWPDKAAFLAVARAALRELGDASSAYDASYNIRHAAKRWPEHDWKAEVRAIKASLAPAAGKPSPVTPILDELLSRL